MWKLSDLTKRILIVDLTSGEIARTEEAPNLYRSFLGGRGLNQFYLYNLLEPTTSPLDPKNPLIFGAGLLSGTPVPGATRISVDSKNVFSNGVGSANAGESLSPALKCSGYGTLIIIGRADDPVYLQINDNAVSIEPAEDLWGKGTSKAVASLRRTLGEDFEVACIGPAGENLVRGACVMVNKSRAAGKCGLGAVMGSKNLKAIAVRGTGDIRVAEPERLSILCREAQGRIKGSSAVKTLSTFGTKAGAIGKNNIGAIAFRHFQDGHMESMAGLDAEAFAPYEQARFSCRGCPISCRQAYHIASGPYAGTQGEAVHCNSIQDFGAKLDIRYTPAIIKAHLLCNEYGMDIDTVAESISWGFECFEKGLLTESDTEGLELTWGDYDILMTLIGLIAKRQGFGDILADGVQRASSIIGLGSEDLAASMKGQDLYEDPRIPKGYGLGAALATRGGGHCSGSPLVEFFAGGLAGTPNGAETTAAIFDPGTAGDPAAYEGKAELVAYYERLHSVLNSLGICFFTSVWEGHGLLNERDLADLVSAATGWDIDETELMNIGERIHTLERLFNARHAEFDRKDDYPPQRFFLEPIKSGAFKGEMLHREKFDDMLDKNYAIHGWNVRGLPKTETLEKLDLVQLLYHLPDYLVSGRPITVRGETGSEVTALLSQWLIQNKSRETRLSELR